MEEQFQNVLDVQELCEIKRFSFTCSVCDEKLLLPTIGFWEAMQKHEHIERVLCTLIEDRLFINQFTKCNKVNIQPLQSEGLNCIDNQPYTSRSFNNEDKALEFRNSLVLSENNSYSDSNYENGQGENDSFEDSYMHTINEQFDENDVNSFKFNFKPSYDKQVQQALYSEKTLQWLRKFDRTDYCSILRVGPSRYVCLLCPCDLVSKSKRRVGKSFLLDHVTGNRHMKQAESIENVNAVNNFHETWLSQKPTVQAHQVYFRPDYGNTLLCVLCHKLIEGGALTKHLTNGEHRSHILHIFEKNSDSTYLVDLQVQLYDIKPVPVIPQHQEMKKDTPKPAVRKNTPRTEARSIPTHNKEVRNPKDVKDVEGDTSPHNIIKSVANASGNTFKEILPNRFQIHSQFLVRHNDGIICKTCQIKFSFKIPDIVAHICEKRHLNLTKVPLAQYKYFCEICNSKIPNELSWQKHLADGPKFHNKVPPSRKERITEYECTKCVTVLFGDELSLGRHLATRGFKKKSESKLSPVLLNVFKTRVTIETGAETLLLEANETLRSSSSTMECCQSIEDHLATVFQGCKAYPFGSRISGLCNQKSDLDIFLDTGDMYTGIYNQDSVGQVQLVKKVQTIICKFKDVFQNVFSRPTARTPIVSFHHKKTNIDCDISFRHGLSVENTKFLRFCFDLLPVSQAFILILKMWSHETQLKDHFSTYALAIMAIFYLQTKGYLLSIKQLRDINRTKGLVIFGWETVRYSLPIDVMRKYVTPCSESVTDLLKDFFLYYSKFPYTVDVVCPLLGHCIKKKDFDNNGMHLPPEMNSYVAQLKSKEPEEFRNGSPLCIQDPFDLSHNLAKALQEGTLNKFRLFCEMSHKLIEDL